MRVTFLPEGSDTPQVWDFRPGRVRNSRAAQIERLYSRIVGERQTYEAFKVAVQQGSAPARQVLLWHLQSLDHPTLRVEDVDFSEDELIVEYTVSELQQVRDAIGNQSSMDKIQREQFLAVIEAEMLRAPEDDWGKATSTSASPDTGSPSPPLSTSDPESSST